MTLTYSEKLEKVREMRDGLILLNRHGRSPELGAKFNSLVEFILNEFKHPTQDDNEVVNNFVKATFSTTYDENETIVDTVPEKFICIVIMRELLSKHRILFHKDDAPRFLDFAKIYAPLFKQR